MLRILTPVTGRQQYSKLHCAPNSRLTYYSDSRMYQVCPVVEFWSRCCCYPYLLCTVQFLQIQRGRIKLQCSTIYAPTSVVSCYHRTGLSTSFSLFRKPKNQCMKKKTYLNFQIPLFPGKQFCKLRIFDLRNPSVRALLRLVTRGKLFSTTTVKGSI